MVWQVDAKRPGALIRLFEDSSEGEQNCFCFTDQITFPVIFSEFELMTALLQ
jgi:hypothetical protein